LNKRNAIICAILVLLAVFRFPTTEIRIMYQVLAEAGAMLALCLMVWRTNKWVALFGVVVVLSTHFPQYTRATFYASFAVMVGLVWFCAVVENATVDGVLDAMLIISVFHVGFQVLQLTGLDPLFAHVNGGDPSAVGLMCNRNEVSALLAFCLPAAFRPKRIWFAIPIIAGLGMAVSYGGVVAAGAAVVVFALFTMSTKWRVVSIVGILAAMCAYLFIDTPGIDARLEIWKNGWVLWAKQFWFGLGIGHWKAYYPAVFGVNATAAHNDIFQGMVEMGAPFILVLVGYAVSIIRRLKAEVALAASGVAAVAVNALVNFPFHIATTAMVAVTWLAVFEMQSRRSENAG